MTGTGRYFFSELPICGCCCIHRIVGEVHRDWLACRLLLALSHSRWLLLTALFGPVSLGLALGSPAVLIAVKRYTKEVGLLFSGITRLFKPLHQHCVAACMHISICSNMSSFITIHFASKLSAACVVALCKQLIQEGILRLMQMAESTSGMHAITLELDTVETQTANMACRATGALRTQCSMQP